jgi:hypothetical protein
MNEGTQLLDTVTITREYYENLKEDSKILSCLEAAGVDNWSGYEFAIDMANDEERK